MAACVLPVPILLQVAEQADLETIMNLARTCSVGALLYLFTSDLDKQLAVVEINWQTPGLCSNSCTDNTKHHLRV